MDWNIVNENSGMRMFPTAGGETLPQQFIIFPQWVVCVLRKQQELNRRRSELAFIPKACYFQWLQTDLISTINKKHIKAFTVQLQAPHIARKPRLELPNLMWGNIIFKIYYRKGGARRAEVCRDGNTFSLSSDWEDLFPLIRWTTSLDVDGCAQVTAVKYSQF